MGVKMKNKFAIITPIRVPVGFGGKLTKRSKQQDFCDANCLEEE